MSKLTESIYTELENINCKSRIVSTDNIELLIKEIQEFYEKGSFEDSFFQNSLSWIKMDLLNKLEDAKSLIIVAIPSPQSIVIFKLKDKLHSLTIPPHYVDYEQRREEIENLLKILLKERNYTGERVNFPLKTLAVRSGLAEYGKNNLCYVSGMGSYLQLVGVSSDMPCNKTIQKPNLMKLCNNCNLCQNVCPTNAISQKRFLLNGERCLTYHNEKKGIIPFPDWIKKSWHNSIVGCIYCQKVCPANKDYLDWEGPEEYFSEKETITLLNNPSIKDLSPNTMDKLKKLNLDYCLDSLSRNLSVLLNFQVGNDKPIPC